MSATEALIGTAGTIIIAGVVYKVMEDGALKPMRRSGKKRQGRPVKGSGRKFGGKFYSREYMTGRKAEAQRVAKKFRASGFNARVERYNTPLGGKAWAVYVRKR